MMGRIFDITSGKEITDNPVKAGEDCETEPLNEEEIEAFLKLQGTDSTRYLRYAEKNGLSPDMPNVTYVRMALRFLMQEIIIKSDGRFAEEIHELCLTVSRGFNDTKLLQKINNSTEADWKTKSTYYKTLLMVALERCRAKGHEFG